LTYKILVLIITLPTIKEHEIAGAIFTEIKVLGRFPLVNNLG